MTQPPHLSSNQSSTFVPPSVASAIRPQILLHKQEDQHIRSVPKHHLTLLVDDSHINNNIHKNPPRKGFNSGDFNPHSHSTLSASTHPTSVSSSSLSLQHESSHLSPRQRMYQTIDSAPITFIIFLLMAIDFCFFLTAYLYILQHQHSPLLRLMYVFVDWATAVLYLVEVNIRLFAYSPQFYFHGVLRCLDYVITSANAVLVVTYSISPDQWLLVTRFIRTLRMVTSLTTWRERKLKGRTRQQLQSLAELLEKEKSDRSKLTKWKIDPEAIAIGESAGRGGFGTVFSGLFRGTLVAVKQVSYSHQEESVTSIEDEAITLVNLRHPNVVLFMGFVHEPSQLWIVTEYCSRGSLRDLLDDNNLRLTEGRILKLALGAARGLAYLHGQDPPVLHLDLKTSNVLISSGWDAKLGDFGLSRSIDKIEKDWFSGTMQYAAPEILEANAFSTAADIYSFGICLWEMAAREVPFQGLSPMAVLWGVVKSRLRPSLDSINVAVTKRAGNPRNDTRQEELQPTSNPRGVNNPQKSGSSHHERNAIRYDHNDQLKAGPTSCVQNYEFDPSGEAPVRREDEGQLFRHEQLFERVEENGRTGNLMKEPVTASIVEGIVLPSTVNTPDKTIFQGTPNGQEDHEERISLSHPRKKKSVLRDQLRSCRGEHDSHLSGLTHKVTETIQMFDERPPIIRKQEVEGSNDYGAQSKTESVAGSVSGGQSSRVGRRNLIEKSSLRLPRQFSKLRSSNKLVRSGSRKEQVSKKDEGDPFLRRLASVSECTKQNHLPADKPDQQQIAAEEISSDDTTHIDNRGCGKALSSTITQAVVPKEYVDLIQKCWSQDPNERPSAGEIVWRLVILIDSQMRDK